jgi:hypothetical protein
VGSDDRGHSNSDPTEHAYPAATKAPDRIGRDFTADKVTPSTYDAVTPASEIAYETASTTTSTTLPEAA